MPDGDSFGGGFYPEPNHRYKVAEGRIYMSVELTDTFPIDEEDEDIRQIIEDNFKDYIDYNKIEFGDLDLSIHVEEE